MGLKNPRVIFGIHEFTPYNRITGAFYGTVRVLSSSSLNLTGELIELKAGSNRYPWDVQDGTIDAEISLTVKEYPDFLFELFLGKAPTTTTAETSGNVSTVVNKFGSSLVAATGIASVTTKVAEKEKQKFGKYIIKVVSATTVDVYASSDVDFRRGENKSFENDALKITAAPLVITTAGVIEIDGFGLEITGGAGVIAMTVGHTAEFYVSPVNSERMEVEIGATSDVFPEFGAIMIAEQKGSGEMVDVEAYRVKAIGLPLGFSEKEYSESEVTAKCFYDADKNAVMKIRYVKPS